MTNESFKAPAPVERITGDSAPAPPPVLGFRSRLLYVADQFEDLHRMRSELLGELILDRSCGLDEAGLVDSIDDLHAHRLQLLGRVRLELHAHRRLLLGNFL